MKILHIIPSIGPVRGGPSEAVLAMVKALRSLNIDAEIVCTNDNGPDLLDVKTGEKIDYENVPVLFFPRFSPQVNFIREFAFSWQFTQWLWTNIKQYDLVHIHAIFSYTSTIAMTIARIKKVPYIIRPLGQLCQWSLEQSKTRKQIYLNLIEKDNINQSKYIHFTSEQEQKESLTNGINADSFILPHGLYFPSTIPNAKQKLREMLNIPETDKIILFMSRLHPKKGLDYLIYALEKIKHQPFTFIIAGSGDPDYEREINLMIEKTGIGQKTQKIGFVKGEMKELLLQGADIFALTSYSENFGISVLEAMANSLTVIVTPGVALSAIIEKENIGYVTEMDREAIAKTIHTCLEQPEIAKEKSDRASQIIYNQYTWSKIAGKLIEIYDSIINVNN
jgi:glycosyltransferase involved in cell wall biosynthesis